MQTKSTKRLTLYFSSVTLLSFSFLFVGCLKQTITFDECNVKNHLNTDPVSVQAQAIISGANIINTAGFSPILEYDSTKTQLPEPSYEFKESFNVSTQLVQGRKVVTVAPKSGTTGKVILWFHGGGYAKNISPEYYGFFGEIVNKTGATLIIPDYGLAPYYNYIQGYALMQEVYDNLVDTYGVDNITIAGDSAGGGFALGFTQKQKIDAKPLPHHLMLLFPWLDIALSNPNIENISDIILNSYSLRQAGLSWAGPSNTNNYQLSPINGSFEGLPPISLFIGGRDMFLPDAKKMKKIMAENCYHLNFYEYPNMFHGWMVLFKDLPESKKVLNEMAAELNN